MKKKINNKTVVRDWTKPTEVSDVDIAFGGIAGLLPEYEEIPQEFKDGRTEWNRVQSKWFFSGLSEADRFLVKSGINERTAFRHLQAIQGSFQPKHEHKSAAVAWLLSLWFESALPNV